VRTRAPVVLLGLVLLACALPAQEVLLDRSVQVGGLTLFASRTEPGVWYYLPDRPHLAVDASGRPEFSFVKYVLPGRSAGGGSQGITRAAGGGVVHLLASYEVPPEAVENAEAELRTLEGHEEDRIAGPILYRDGSYQLVSAVVSPDGEMTRRVLGAGKAPLIEGERAAISLDLTPEGASLLWQTLDMEHPDLTLVFSMRMAGYRTPYEAELVVDWDRLYHHQAIKAGLKIYWVGIDVDALVESLLTDGTIQVNVKGESAPMEKLLQSAYDRVTRILFEEAPPGEESTPAAASSGSSLGRIIDAARSATDRCKNIDLTARYRLRHVRRSGKARLSLRQETEEPLFVLLSADIGSVAARHRGDPAFFRAVNLEDPTFRQREVSVTYDGDAAAFAEALNHVVVQLRKRHGDGSVTLREAMLRPGRLAGEHGPLVFTYPNAGDGDPLEWLNYEWRAIWSFRQGFDHDTGWRESNAFAIALRPPFLLRRLTLDGDRSVLEAAHVRAVTAEIEWELLGHTERRVVTIRPRRLPRTVPVLLSRETPTVRVTLRWHLAGGRRIETGPWEERSDIVFVDEIPATTAPGTGAGHGGA